MQGDLEADCICLNRRVQRWMTVGFADRSGREARTMSGDEFFDRVSAEGGASGSWNYALGTMARAPPLRWLEPGGVVSVSATVVDAVAAA